ncbi:MAG: TIGR00266 family protein [Candidatus Altiarchaeales archaeon]|nr:TIGR00266 family protein [Candidatus Altiarchaeales archaeon]MBD3416143.1 TIGR00266 family protein [Candidatus Altiarchaeales archaeon]
MLDVSVEYEIIGDDMQAVIFKLKNGERIRAEAGAMMLMDASIRMETTTGGGIMQGLKRVLTRESFFIPHFECTGPEGEVGFSGPFPGKIVALDVGGGRSILCQKDSYLCSTDRVDVSIGFTKKLGAGFFGGEGFILQKLEGEGQVFVHAGGTVIERVLQAGEELRVDTGCLVAFDDSVQYDIKFIGGVRNVLFGGEGLFFALLRGPGKVLIQTLPFSRLADRVISASRLAGGGGRGEVGGLRSVFGGDKGF